MYIHIYIYIMYVCTYIAWTALNWMPMCPAFHAIRDSHWITHWIQYFCISASFRSIICMFIRYRCTSTLKYILCMCVRARYTCSTYLLLMIFTLNNCVRYFSMYICIQWFRWCVYVRYTVSNIGVNGMYICIYISM